MHCRLNLNVPCAVGGTCAASGVVDAYLAERNKYKTQNERRAKEGSDREVETLKMLAAFQSKMERSRKLAEYVSAGVAEDDAEAEQRESDDNKDNDDDDVHDNDANNLSWFVCVCGLYLYCNQILFFVYVLLY